MMTYNISALNVALHGLRKLSQKMMLMAMLISRPDDFQCKEHHGNNDTPLQCPKRSVIFISSLNTSQIEHCYIYAFNILLYTSALG